MSAIGTRNFFVVGYFRGVPVYQPLWRESLDISRLDSRRTNMEPGQLIIGGGGGEHPAVIFRDLEFCVASLLLSKWSPVEVTTTSELECAADIMNKLPAWEFCSWHVDHYRRFLDRCQFDYAHYTRVNSFGEEDEPFLDESGKAFRNTPGTYFEMWLCFNVGEFVYGALPSISPKVQRWREMFGPMTNPCFRGILVAPPGYPDEGVDGESEVDMTKERERGGAARFKVIDRFPGYHKNPDFE